MIVIGKEDTRLTRYLDITGTSNVAYYEIGKAFIEVCFNGTTRSYRYSYEKAGRVHVENMKRLARSGHGLNGYINRYARFLYDEEM